MPRKTPALQAGSISQFWVTPSHARFVGLRFLPAEVCQLPETTLVEHSVALREEAVPTPLCVPSNRPQIVRRVVR